MNINIVKLSGVVAQLKGIREQLTRLADCWEMELAHQGINMRPPKADTSGPEPSIGYTDEEEDYARELIEWDRKVKGHAKDESEDDEPQKKEGIRE